MSVSGSWTVLEASPSVPKRSWTAPRVVLDGPGNHSGITLRSVWDQFGIILGQSGITLGPFWDHSGIAFGLFWDHFGIIVDSLWDHFKSFWDHLG